MSNLPTFKDLNGNKKFISKIMSSSNLSELQDEKILKSAFCQNPINEEKVENLINSYKSKDGEFIHELRNEITFCVYPGADNKYEYYNIDGQHRMEMGIKLWKEEPHNIDLKFNVKFMYCVTTDDIRRFFDELNHDSKRKEYSINNDYFLYDLRNLLELKYKDYFVNKEKRNSHLLTINEFISNLQEINIEKYIDEKEYQSASSFLEDIIKSNKKYNSKVNEHGYTELLDSHKVKRTFYTDEYEILNQTNVLTIGFRRNNFLVVQNDDGLKRGWFFRNRSLKPTHDIIRDRANISEKQKKTIWRNEYEDKISENSDSESENDIYSMEFKCPVTKCKNIISYETCEMGHKKSKANGGLETIDNLRPICRPCNQKMSDKNWKDYERELRETLKKST